MEAEKCSRMRSMVSLFLSGYLCLLFTSENAGMKGEAGINGEKGSMGPKGMPGAKGEPGESLSAPTVFISPVKLTVNEKGSASFWCSARKNNGHQN